MSEFTREELLGFGRRAEVLFFRQGGIPGRDVRIGRFFIEHVPDAGIWVYWLNDDDKKVQIYGHSISNTHADISDAPYIERALNDFRRLLILEELADV
jgi:hypothetical protein